MIRSFFMAGLILIAGPTLADEMSLETLYPNIHTYDDLVIEPDFFTVDTGYVFIDELRSEIDPACWTMPATMSSAPKRFIYMGQRSMAV